MLKEFFKNIIWCAKEILFPRKCIFCGSVINERKDILACEKCEKTLPLDMNERSFEIIGNNVKYLAAPFLYEGEVRNAIKAFKFSSKPYYGKTFAYFMNDTLKEICKSEKIDFIVPIPLHEKRLKKRGYNQAELLAEALEVPGAVYDKSILVKVKNTGKQSLKNAHERVESVKGSYMCAKDVSGKNILLTDDICTTGATLNICADVLKKAGAANIICITAARRFPQYESSKNNFLYFLSYNSEKQRR